MKARKRDLGAFLSALGLAVAVGVPGHAETKLERGRYLATIMDCGGCHTTGSLTGKPDPSKYLAGGDVGWLIPETGVFYPSNLTSDPATGLGTWTEADIVGALKTGRIPGGRVLVPVMPWPAYSRASDADLEALAFYLKQVPAVSHAVPEPTALKDVKTPYVTVAMPPPP